MNPKLLKARRTLVICLPADICIGAASSVPSARRPICRFRMNTAMRTRWINISGGVCRGTLTALLALILIFGAASIGVSQKASASVQSQSDPYLLDAAEIAGKKDFQIAVPTNGLIHLTFIKVNPTNESNVFLYLSPFYGDRSGGELRVELSTTNLVFGAAQSIASSLLKADPVPMPENYTGTLVLSGGGISPILWRMTLTKANGLQDRPASLAVIPPKISCAVDLKLFRSRDTSNIINAVTLRNTNKTWPLEGIAVIPGEIIGAADPDFSIANNVRFYLNGTNIPSITQLPPNPGDEKIRSIQAGGQVTLGLGFEGLKHGDHTFELIFSTMDSRDDQNQQKLTVNVKAANSVWSAVGVLIAAIGLSVVIYKLLEPYQNRIQLQRRAAALRALLPKQPAIYADVWVRMLLRQAEYLAGRLWLAGTSFGKECLDQAEPVLEALIEAQKTRQAWKSEPEFVRNRYSFVVDDIYEEMRAGGMTKEAAENAKAKFIQLQKDIASSDDGRYWKEVTKAVQNFRNSYDPSHLPSAPPANVEDAIKRILKSDPPAQPSGRDMMEYETAFARLNLLYERRGDPDLCAQLIKAFDKPLDDYFALADDAAWNNIKKAAGHKKLSIIAPPVGNKSVGEAYEPIEFSIKTGNEALDKTYLFTHLLRYEWSFRFKSSSLFPKSSRLEPETVSPSVAQFATKAGTWTVSVRLIRTTRLEPDSVHVLKSDEVRVDGSSDVKSLVRLDHAEWLALVIAVVFALVTGLLTFYYKNPVFGSMQDYLTLFIWGVGVDQTKNFLQSIQPGSQDPKSQAPKSGQN